MVIRPTHRQRGAAYIALIVAVAVTSAALAAAATVWSQAQQRERERDLLWTGEQFRRALRSYAAGDGTLPRRLEDLLEDARTPARRRHLRRLYVDPMTGQADWVLLRDARGGIAGVHSRSERAPLKTGGFGAPQAGFANAERYADWQFLAAALPAARQPRLAPAASAPDGPRTGPGS
jgi:type II secretory pathway pseudopilin PulG